MIIKIYIDKQKVVAKNPKRQEQKKSRETYMKRLKEKILDDNQLPTPSPTGNSTPSTSSSTGNSTLSTSSLTGNSTSSTSSHVARSNDTHVYTLVYLLSLPLVFVYFLYTTFPRLKKKQVNEKPDQQPKRRHVL